MNLPNKLTIGRVLAVPLIVALLYFENRATCLLAALVFAAASFTDFIDGMLARREGIVTNFGKFLDPLADKLLVGSTMIMLVGIDRAPAWLVIVIIARETAVTGMRTLAVEQGVVMAADKYGKIKTVLQIAALIPLLVHYEYFAVDFHALGTVLLYLALVMTVFSGANYLYRFHKNWLYGS